MKLLAALTAIGGLIFVGFVLTGIALGVSRLIAWRTSPDRHRRHVRDEQADAVRGVSFSEMPSHDPVTSGKVQR